MNDDIQYAYAAYRPCGCMCVAIADRPVNKKEIGKKLKEWVANGLTVQRVLSERVKTELVWSPCPHENQPVPLPALPMFPEL